MSTSKIAVVATPRISSQGFCLRSTAITRSSIHRTNRVTFAVRGNYSPNSVTATLQSQRKGALLDGGRHLPPHRIQCGHIKPAECGSSRTGFWPASTVGVRVADAIVASHGARPRIIGFDTRWRAVLHTHAANRKTLSRFVECLVANDL